MKVTVEPTESESVNSLEELAALVDQAKAMVRASGAAGSGDTDPPTVARVRLNASAQVKSIEVTW